MAPEPGVERAAVARARTNMVRWMSLILIGTSLLACGGDESVSETREQEEENMEQAMTGTREELEALYTSVRDAMAAYDLEAVRPHVDIPEGQPEPTREQAAQLARMMPDVSAGRFLVQRSAPGKIGLYYETALDDASTSEVTVIRFEQRDGQWGLSRRTFNSSSTDKISPEELLSKIDSDPDLAL